MNSRSRHNSKESGMVAIMVTLILMIVISLIVIGFAQISRRNQRQALDRQLSTQAFYAAESGVNDAAERIKNALASGTTTIPAKDDCASTGGGFYATGATSAPTIDAANNVAYTCLTVDPSPESIERKSLGTRASVFRLAAESGTISSLTIRWLPELDTTSTTPANNCPASKTNVFAAAASWGTCGYGVIRFDLVPTAGSSLSASSLQSSAMSAFVVPLRPSGSGGVGSIGYSTGGGNNLLGTVCTQTSCTLTITGLSQSQYHLRISSLYKEVPVVITATDAGGGAVSFVGAQAVVDATGRAQDVLRRIQVRVPLAGSGTNELSDFALQSGEAICKRFSVMDNFFELDSSVSAALPGVGSSTSNSLCQF